MKESLQIVDQAIFTPFAVKAGLDSLVNKGFFSIGISYKGNLIHIVNTHLQSDFTDIPHFRINYGQTRELQEAQLFMTCETMRFPFLCGDFNKNKFLYFEPLDKDDHVTFPTTGEHLDHLLVPKRMMESVKSFKVIYFPEVLLSDHIPVLYEFDL